jgi:hypothetical protein
MHCFTSGIDGKIGSVICPVWTQPPLYEIELVILSKVPDGWNILTEGNIITYSGESSQSN